MSDYDVFEMKEYDIYSSGVLTFSCFGLYINLQSFREGCGCVLIAMVVDKTAIK